MIRQRASETQHTGGAPETGATTNVSFPDLFRPQQVGCLTSPNSVKYVACSVSNFGNPDGSISGREIARKRVVCRTGAGIITNQGAYPDPEGLGKAHHRQLSIAEDRFIPGIERIAEMIHDSGALAIQQLLRAGRYGGIQSSHALQPSAAAQTLPHFRPPRAVTASEIKACIDHHVEGAKRALRAGFDGVEVTAFMGYLLATFLSPFTNNRTNEYGGTFERRGRFMVDLIKAVKHGLGNRVLWIRLNATKLMDNHGGNTEQACLGYMQMAEAAGADGISVVIRWHESIRRALGRDLPTDQGLYLAEQAKRVLTVPIAFGSRFGDPLLAERALAKGKIDFWEVCRPFLADPELLIKVKEDRVNEIKPCVGGLMCLSRLFRNVPYVCSMNPILGHEYEPEYRITETKRKKAVFVIGGGPAGMAAAVTAARKGHEVTLLEQDQRPGGQLKAASMKVAVGQEFKKVIDYNAIQMEKQPVTVKLNTLVDWSLVTKLRPDGGTVATGAETPEWSLPGLDRAKAVHPDRLEEDELPTSRRVIILGGERAGLVAAERYAQEGNHVALVDEGRKLAQDVIPTFKWRHISWLHDLGIEVIKSTRAVGASSEGLHLRDRNNPEMVRPFDFIVVSAPRMPINSLTRELMFSCDELYTVGDAVAPRDLCDAVHEGYGVGVRI